MWVFLVLKKWNVSYGCGCSLGFVIFNSVWENITHRKFDHCFSIWQNDVWKRFLFGVYGVNIGFFSLKTTIWKSGKIHIKKISSHCFFFRFTFTSNINIPFFGTQLNLPSWSYCVFFIVFFFFKCWIHKIGNSFFVPPIICYNLIVFRLDFLWINTHLWASYGCRTKFALSININ